MGNCAAWVIYGLSVANPYVFWANAPGLLCGVYMFSSGMRLGNSEQRRVLETLALGIAVTLLTTGFTMGLILEDPAARAALAVAQANAFCFALYASPLSSLGEVLRAKSSASLCLPLLAASLANALLWTAYGGSQFPR